MSLAVSVLHSARREIGTQTSVERARDPGRLQAGEVGVVARFPELGALLRLGRPLEVEPAVLARNVLHRFRLLHHRCGAAVELEKERGRFGIRGLVVAVEGRHRRRAQKLAARVGMPAWSVSITVFAAPSMSGKAHTAADIACTGWSFTVTSVMMPSVPSEPTKRRVRS